MSRSSPINHMYYFQSFVMANPKSKLSKFGCGNKKTLLQSSDDGTDSYQELVILF